jgi:hypothetical protein
MRLDFKDKRQSEVRYISLPEVQKIARDHGNTKAPSYTKDEPQMHEKIAVKQMLKRVFAEAESRAQASFADLMDEPEPVVIRDREERLNRAMSGAATTMKPADPTPEPEVQDDPEPEPEPKAAEGAPDPGGEELF